MFGEISALLGCNSDVSFVCRNYCKIACLDIAPNTTSQLPDVKNVLNLGGFADSVFTVLDGFFNTDENNKDGFVATIEQINL